VKSITVIGIDGMNISIKQARAVANMMCGFNDDSWKKRDFGGLSGEAKNDICESFYDNFTSGNGYITLIIKRLKDLPN
jgi:hypothetical protein